MSDDTYRLTDTEWREYQNIPEQGYSHRAWIDHKIAERLQAAATEHPDGWTRTRLDTPWTPTEEA